MKKNKVFKIIILVFIFFLVYSSIYFSLRPKAVGDDMWIFNTPDETANHFFINSLAREGSLKYYEPLNEVSGDLNLVHPRSTTVVDNNIVPGSFLGFILIMGVIAKIFSLSVVPYITPLFSIFAVVSFYLLLKNIFNKNIAFLSSVLLLVTPAFWYYNSRSLFNNVLFIDFIIIAIWLLFKFYISKNNWTLISSGLLFGLALSMRASDLVWVAFLVIVILVFHKKVFKWKDFVIMAVSSFVSFVPVLFIGNSIYGSPFITGYTPSIGDKLSGGGFYLNLIKQILMPFGINIMNAFSNFYYFFIDMFPWHFWPAFLGGLLLTYLWKKNLLREKEKYYFAVTLIISVFIMLYYGSWSFFDNLFNAPLIGSSQTRYMLPIYILSLPLIAYLLDFVVSKIKIKSVGKILIILFIVSFASLSANAVLYSGPESLYSVRDTVMKYHNISKQVRAITEDNSVIITSYNDKLFFPERKIIFYWQDLEYLENISTIARVVPVYFYSIDWQNDINYIIDNSTLDADLILELNETEALYRIYP